MTTVVVSPEAEAQVRAIDAWWMVNRPQAPGLFLHELAEAFELLRHFAALGQRVPHASVADVRRVLLRATHYHVYYIDGARDVRVVAVWSAIRERGPDLRGL